MPIVDAAKLEQLTGDIFAARGVPSADAKWIATMLVRANLRGHDSHGVIRIPHYVRSMKAGEVNPTPTIRVLRETPTLALVDGDLGFGQIVARRGIAIAIEKAKAQGMSAVTLKRTNHVGRLADYAEMAAAEGLIGMVWVNAPMALNVAPWGGAAPWHQSPRHRGAGARRQRGHVDGLRDQRRGRGQAEGEAQPG
jgi:hydroxycarboxylate dehydrogenase B